MSDLPRPARALSAAISRAVSAAQSADREAYESATAELNACNPEHAGIVASAIIRTLLENMHPDGLDGDDIHAVLERCLRDTVTWLPDVDATSLIVVLAGALGVHETGDANQADDRTGRATNHESGSEWSSEWGSETDGQTRPPTRTDVARHAPLIIADLLRASGRRLGQYLDTAFAEIARAETMEMP